MTPYWGSTPARLQSSVWIRRSDAVVFQRASSVRLFFISYFSYNKCFIISTSNEGVLSYGTLDSVLIGDSQVTSYVVVNYIHTTVSLRIRSSNSGSSCTAARSKEYGSSIPSAYRRRMQLRPLQPQPAVC